MPASARTRRLSSLLTGSTILASTRCRNTSSPPEAELQGPRSHPLPGRGLQRLQLGLVVRRSEVLDAPRPAPR
jgi:hypothetical protein